MDRETEGEAPVEDQCDAFVSYSHEDRELALALRTALEQRGKKVWLDESSIHPAERWEVALRRAIEGAHAVVFVISPASAASAECRKELDWALGLNKRIIPVVGRAIDPEQLPEALAALQFVPSRGEFERDFERSLLVLISALDTDLDWVREHTDWGQKAVEWEDHHRDKSFLLAGSELELAEQWRSRSAGKEPGPSEFQNQYIDASRRAATIRLRRTRAFVSVALVVAVGLAVLAFLQRQQAVHERQVASSGELAAESILQLNVDPQLSLLLADRAARTQPTAAALDALRRSLAANHLLETFRADDRPLEAAQWSPSGSRVLTIGDDGHARIWSVSSGRVIRTLPGSTSRGQGASFSRDGRLVLTWFPGKAQAWRVDGSHPQVTFTDPGFFQLEAAALSPDGTIVATASGPGAEGSEALWDARTGRRLHTLERESNGNISGALAFSPDNRLLATGSENGTASIWSVRTRRLVRVLDVSRAASAQSGLSLVYPISFSPNGTRLAISAGNSFSGSPNQPEQTEVWNPDNGRLVARVNGSDATWSPDSRFLATTSSDGTARVWNPGTGALVSQMKGTFQLTGPALFAPAAFDPSTGRRDAPSYVQTGSQTGFGAVWNELSGTQIALLAGDTGSVAAAGFSPSGDRVLTYSSDGSARVWDTGVVSPIVKPVTRSLARLESSFDDLSAPAEPSYEGSPLGSKVAFLTSGTPASPRLLVVDTRTGTTETQLSPEPGYRYAGAAFDAAGATMIVTRESDSFAPAPAELRQARDGRLLRVLGGPAGRAVAGTLSPDGSLALTLDRHNVLTVWDVKTGRPVTSFAGHQHHRLSFGLDARMMFKFSPDGRLVLSSDEAGYSYVWQARTGRVLNAIHGPAEPPGMWSGWGGAISPDDQLVVTVASWDSAAHVYRVGRRAPLITLRGSEQDIEDAVFSPDSSLMATLSSDGARLWSTREPSPILTLNGSFGSTVAFSTDGRSLVTNGSAASETLPCVVCGGFDRLLTAAARRETRTLTAAERALYVTG